MVSGREAIRGGSPGENARLIRRIFEGKVEDERDRARRDIVVMNAAAALVAAGVVKDFQEGSEKAEQAIVSGKAAEKLEALRRFGHD